MAVDRTISELIVQANLQARGRSVVKRKARDPTRPAAKWVTTTRIGDGIGSALSTVLGTIGCSHARGEAGGCTMCSYLLDGSSKNPTAEELVQQFSNAITQLEGLESPLSVKIYTSGSFFDEEEVPATARSKILRMLSDDERISEVVLESRPEYVSKGILSEVAEQLDHCAVEIGVGLESSNDRVRSLCVNKGFDFDEFKDSVEKAREQGIGVRAYVLMKPPFLTEMDAILDARNTIADALDVGVTTISINPVNVQKNTLVEVLWKKHRYRPPWLWSVLDVLGYARSIAEKKVNIICDPVAVGKRRGAHNCGKCDEAVADSIRNFVLTQNPRSLETTQCACHDLWNHTKEHEDVAHLVHQ